jgi:hypothetical protein
MTTGVFKRPEAMMMGRVCDFGVWVNISASRNSFQLARNENRTTATSDGAASGSLAGFGALVRAGGTGPQELPLSLTVGAWLLDRAEWPTTTRSYRQVGPTGAAAGHDEWPAADAWLVMGDGTARLSERAPGGLDPAAIDYDSEVLGALASGDPAALADLDPATGARMMAAGAPAWRAVGAALRTDSSGRRRWTARVLSHQAPYGVSYLVATWT